MNTIKMTHYPEVSYAYKESVNTLCTNLSFMGANKKVIMLTSVQSHEGKSLMTLSTALTMAELGYKVVMVDMDLRKSQLKSRYSMQVTEGTGEGAVHYLSGKANIESILYRIEGYGLDIVPVGRTVQNSLPLLNSNKVSELLKRLRGEYDYVFVDAPPIGMIIDAAEISKSCDGALLIVKYNTVTKTEIVDAKRQLEQAKCEILGAVLNDVAFDTLSSKHYYNKHYYSHYESGYYAEHKPQKEKPEKKRSIWK